VPSWREISNSTDLRRRDWAVIATGVLRRRWLGCRGSLPGYTDTMAPSCVWPSAAPPTGQYASGWTHLTGSTHASTVPSRAKAALGRSGVCPNTISARLRRLVPFALNNIGTDETFDLMRWPQRCACNAAELYIWARLTDCFHPYAATQDRGASASRSGMADGLLENGATDQRTRC